MRIACVGGGPAGLYFALLMKLRDPSHDITIFERNSADSAQGWGVTFPVDLLEKLRGSDPRSAREIEQAAFSQIDQVVDIRGTRVPHPGGGGYSISRQRLLDILAARAQALGARIEFGQEVMAPSRLPEPDLIVASDGVSSRTRLAGGGFQTDVRLGGNKYIWLGTPKVFECFTYAFVQTGSGWVWAYGYGVDAESSTFIVECSSGTWAGLGFDTMPLQDGLSRLENLFERQLDGHPLIGQVGRGASAAWLNFRTVTNRRWHDGNIVLTGDAAHTTHFTIGSGTTLAIEDAIALAENLARHRELKPALECYERQRKAALLQPQSDARFSAQWFENVARYTGLEPHEFSALLHGRRSPLLPRLPPRLYYRLHHATEEVAVLRELRSRVGPKAKAIYSRRRPVRPGDGAAHPQVFREMELDGTVRVSLIRPGELGEAEIAAWRSMQQATPSLANPFLSPEFAMAVGRFRPRARIAVLTEGQSITGFFPFERRRLGTGAPVCGWLTPCQGLIHAPGADWDPRELLRGCRLSAWRFDNLLTDQRPFQAYHAATVASPMIDLSDGFEAYYAKLRVKSPRFCRELGRRARKLGRELGELRIAADSRDTSALRTLMGWKSGQYRQTSHVDRFEQPWLVGLLDTLLATRGPHVSGLLSVLYAGDQPVAAQFGLRTGSLFVGWFTGYETSLGKYSPGLLHLERLAGELAAAGVRVIDMGGGARNYYKETLKSGDAYVAQGIVTTRSVIGTAHRVRSSLTWSARRTVRQRPGLHHAADQLLRRSGAARRIYGRV